MTEENIKWYFGENIHMYFCWMQFYQKWLAVAAVTGLITYYIDKFWTNKALI